MTFQAKSGTVNVGNAESGNNHYAEVTITTNGNPVYFDFTADANPRNATSVWFQLNVYRDGTEIARTCSQADYY